MSKMNSSLKVHLLILECISLKTVNNEGVEESRKTDQEIQDNVDQEPEIINDAKALQTVHLLKIFILNKDHLL